MRAVTAQGIPGGNWTVQAQIRADRYYAAHLLGDLKDPRGVDVLIPLLNDEDVASIVPWSPAAALRDGSRLRSSSSGQAGGLAFALRHSPAGSPAGVSRG